MKIFAITHKLSRGSAIGFMPWKTLPDNVWLIEYFFNHDLDGYVSLRLVVRCEEAVGKEMGWIPAERST